MAKKKMTDDPAMPSMASASGMGDMAALRPTTAKSEETITVSKNMAYGIVIVALLVLLAASLFTGGFGLVKPGTGTGTGAAVPAPSPSPSPSPAPSPAPTVGSIQISGGSLPVRGSSDAPVKLIEFSDYQCPYCGRFYKETETVLQAKYVDTGKMQFYYRDYPIPQLHRYAGGASLAARCANEQGKFWEYHDQLFIDQGAWSAASENEITGKFTQYATALGMDGEKFSQCLSSQKYAAAVDQDLQEGQVAYGSAMGTPTFFLVIPKAKVSQSALMAALSASPYYSQGYMGLKQTDQEYVVVITGALPAATFQSILDTVSY